MPLLDRTGAKDNRWIHSEDGTAEAEQIIVSFAHLKDALAGNGRGRDRKSTRLNSSHSQQSRMPSSA